MFDIKKNKKFSYQSKESKNEPNINFKRKAQKSKSRLSIYLIMLILIFGLLFYLKNYIIE